MPASCLLEDLDLSLTESDGWSCVGGGPEGGRGGGNISADSAVEELELDADESVGGTGLLDVDVAAGPVLAGLGVPDCGEVGGPCGRVLEEYWKSLVEGKRRCLLEKQGRNPMKTLV